MSGRLERCVGWCADRVFLVTAVGVVMMGVGAIVSIVVMGVVGDGTDTPETEYRIVLYSVGCTYYTDEYSLLDTGQVHVEEYWRDGQYMEEPVTISGDYVIVAEGVDA